MRYFDVIFLDFIHIISPLCQSQSEQNDKTPISRGFENCHMPPFHIYSKTQSQDCRWWSAEIRLKLSPRYRFTDTNFCLGCCPDRQLYSTASNAGLTAYLDGPYFLVCIGNPKHTFLTPQIRSRIMHSACRRNLLFIYMGR